MLFKTRFHEGIRNGRITCTVRIWQRPRVKVGGRYRLGDGAVVVDRIRETRLEDITPALARRSGFASVVDLLKTAKHGTGERVFVIDFTTTARDPPHRRARRPSPPRRGSPSSRADSMRWTGAHARDRGRGKRSR